jgi:hypothetical protein
MSVSQELGEARRILEQYGPTISGRTVEQQRDIASALNRLHSNRQDCGRSRGDGDRRVSPFHGQYYAVCAHCAAILAV